MMMKKEKVVIFVAVAFMLGFISGTLITVMKTSNESVPVGGTSSETIGQKPSPVTGSAIDPEKVRLMEQALLDKTRLNPDQAEAWTQLGNFYFDTNQYLKSIESYERSLELKPDNPHVMTDMGIMYRRVGKPEKAAELFRKVTQKDPRHAQSLFNLGIVLKNDLNDIPGAIEAWEQYLQIDPNNVHAGMVRSWVEELKKAGQGASK
ncbi:MAG: tetratricopeptide repeat protein [Deltaproteobacteria bacterium]|nr:tetratricopeptide repeat protein [Deltaproteobacteria bacterium]MBW2306564.1 tetratricopeptide repeat protein [Deltaproteobacteria bacterium]